MSVPSITCDLCKGYKGGLFSICSGDSTTPIHFHSECREKALQSIKRILNDSNCNDIWKTWNFEEMVSADPEEAKLINPYEEMMKPDVYRNIINHQVALKKNRGFFTNANEQDMHIITNLVTWSELFE